MKHTHAFQYQVTESHIPEVPNQSITVEADGDINLPNIVALFESYLKAVGYVFPEGQHLDIVPDEADQSTYPQRKLWSNEELEEERTAQAEDVANHGTTAAEDIAQIARELSLPWAMPLPGFTFQPSHKTKAVRKTAKRKKAVKLGKLD